jgi:hypothetical protein
MWIVLVRLFTILFVFTLAACERKEGTSQEEKGSEEPGPARSPGPAGPTGGTVIRFVDGECRQICTVACEANERILNAFAIGPTGSFVFEDENRATFRPQRQGASVRVVLACAQK